MKIINKKSDKYNPSTFEYDSVIPSSLSTKNIIMIGRTKDPIKRFEIGIISMKIIINEIPKCKMIIVGLPEKKYEKLINNLELENYINFSGYNMNIDKYLKSSSLLILTSFAEAYPMALSEAKIFGIPTIICGLDYLYLSKGGTIMVYDDSPQTIAKEAIKLLKDDKYRKNLGREARKSMKKIRNNIIAKKWSKLFISIYKGYGENYLKLASEKNKNKISQKDAEKILNYQFTLWKKRMSILKNINLKKLKSFFY